MFSVTIYTDTLTSANGCDSVVTTNLTVLPHSATTVDTSICNGESYFAAGAAQTATGVYYDTLVSANGCDSVVTTNLTVTPTVATSVSEEICSGEIFRGIQIFANTIYVYTLTSAPARHSVDPTNLTVLPRSATTVDTSICSGESYFAAGAAQTVTGVYYDTLISANGCDSVVTTNLTVFPKKDTVENISLCAGDFFRGIQLFSDTIFTDSLSTANGCDSVVTTNLTVTPTVTTSVSEEICSGEIFRGIQIFADTIFVDTLASAAGCDSVVTTNLTVLPHSATTVDTSICSGESYFAAGAAQTVTAVYLDTLISVNGCDSVVTKNLIVLSHSVTTVVTSICYGESYFAS